MSGRPLQQSDLAIDALLRLGTDHRFVARATKIDSVGDVKTIHLEKDGQIVTTFTSQDTGTNKPSNAATQLEKHAKYEGLVTGHTGFPSNYYPQSAYYTISGISRKNGTVLIELTQASTGNSLVREWATLTENDNAQIINFDLVEGSEQPLEDPEPHLAVPPHVRKAEFLRKIQPDPAGETKNKLGQTIMKLAEQEERIATLESEARGYQYALKEAKGSLFTAFRALTLLRKNPLNKLHIKTLGTQSVQNLFGSIPPGDKSTSAQSNPTLK